MTRRLSFAVVLFFLGGSFGCYSNAKNEEKRLLAEIERVAKESDAYIVSDEMRLPLIRLNELRPSFPERRDEMIKEAEAVKQAFGRTIEDDRKLIELFKSLLRLPLSESYAKCIDTQIQSQEITTITSQRVIQQMELLSDPAIGDLQKLTQETDRIRYDPDLEKKNAELETYLNQNCRRPPSASENK